MDFNRLEIADLLEGYQRKEFSPSEVAQSLLTAIEKRDGDIRSFLEVRPDVTLDQARAVEKRTSEFQKLPLFGIPIAIKDNILVKGWKATAASKMLHNYVSPYTAMCVERLEACGAVILGKTNLDEFAMGSSTENSSVAATKNPWNLERVPGGSSGGSAAAVAAGLVPASLGTDTGGSIRQPASLCGIVGVKPTYGRVSRYGLIAFASSLDQAGPLARSVWDAARVLECMAGYGGKDATVSRSVVPKYTESLNESVFGSVRNLRVGVSTGWLEGVDAEVRASFEAAIEKFKELGMRVVDIELPNVKHALSTYYLVATSEASSNLARFDGVHYGYRAENPTDLADLYSRSRGEGFGPEVKLRIMLGTYALSAGYYDAYYGKASQVRRLIQQDFEAAFEKCDVIASPTSPTTAFKLGEKVSDPLTMYLSDIFTLPANLAGIPGISLPSGLDTDRLPIGMQLMGKHFDESTLFQVAYAYERRRGSLANPPWKGVSA
jgi:aspartyl-tRNA(Asn)/glutamyl-tRNA(Gln) amidotransferase subunit A